MKNLSMIYFMSFIACGLLIARSDPFESSKSGGLGPQGSDPFAAPTGVNGNPFEEDDPFSETAGTGTESELQEEYVDVLPPKKKRSIVVIEGSKAQGTGFVAKLNDILFVVTNIHVIKNNENLTFMTMDGKKLSINGVFAAKGYDVAILRLEDQDHPYFFEITKDIFSKVAVGTEILVPGNSMGDGTILQTKGKVISVGPKLIEHDAPTFSGNSGSPIIKTDDWTVVGVDTFSTKRDRLEWFNQHSKDHQESQIKDDIRLFGYRIDNVKEWERIDLVELQRQHEEILTIETEALSVLSAVWGSDWHYQRSDTVSRIVNRFLERTSNPRMASSDVEYQKKVARWSLYNHLKSMQKKAMDKKREAYRIMHNDYSRTVKLCEELIEYVGRYYKSDSSVDPFETR